MKLAKLSLAAVVAAGAMTFANATPLEEAIKGIDVTGYTHYRWTDSNEWDGNSEIELRMQFVTPVVENGKLTTRFTADGTNSQHTTTSTGDFQLDRVIFSYDLGMATFNLGRMYAGTPADDSAANGGQVLVKPMDGLTLLGAYYYDLSSITNAVASVAVMYSNDMFNGRIWYSDVQEETGNDEQEFLFVEAGANVGPVTIKAQYAENDKEALADKQSTIRFQVAGKAGPVALRAGYTVNDKDGGNVTLDGAAEGDTDLINGGTYALVNSYGADDESIFLEASMPVGPATITAGYVAYDDHQFDSQYYGKVSYNVTKKISTYVRGGVADYDASGMDDKTRFRFHVQYTF